MLSRLALLIAIATSGCSSVDEWPVAPSPRRAPSEPTHECSYARRDGTAGTWQNGSRVADVDDAKRLCEAQMSTLNIGADCRDCRAISDEPVAPTSAYYYCDCAIRCISGFRHSLTGYFQAVTPDVAAQLCLGELDKKCVIGRDPDPFETKYHCR